MSALSPVARSALRLKERVRDVPRAVLRSAIDWRYMERIDRARGAQMDSVIKRCVVECIEVLDLLARRSAVRRNELVVGRRAASERSDFAVRRVPLIFAWKSSQELDTGLSRTTQKKAQYTFEKAPWYTGREKNRKRRFLLLCKRAR